MRKELGKIVAIKFGLGGYQDACIGLSISFGGKGWGVNTFIGGWAIERSDYCKWTEEDRLRDIGKAGMKLVEMLNATRKTDVTQLVGTPVECSFEGNELKDWRLLDEVL
jgi:hypothetical protein